MTVQSLISLAYINGVDGSSADHCQPKKKTDVCILRVAIPSCKSETKTSEVDKVKEPQIEEPQKIKIQHKGTVYDMPITETTTLGDVKHFLLQQLSLKEEENEVKFVFLGRVYKDNLNNVELRSLKTPPFGITLQSMVSPKRTNSGGKRKTRIRNKKVVKKNATKKIKKRVTKKNRK